MSAVIEYLAMTHRLSCAHGGQSWQVINHAMAMALTVAIKGRFHFEKDDFKNLCRSNGGWPDNGYLGWTRWFPDGGEGYYNLAVEAKNLSAAIAFENWKGRKPFIWKGNRLHIGSRFELEPNQFWYCTSFAEDGSYLNFGSYTTEENPMGWQENSPVGKGPVKRLQFTVRRLKHFEAKLKLDLSNEQNG